MLSCAEHVSMPWPCLPSCLVAAQIIPWGDKESLKVKQRQLNVDILITGHTHTFEVEQYQGHGDQPKLLLNPGSATGASSGSQGMAAAEVTPSFLLMDIQSSAVVTYVYKLDAAGQVKVEKNQYKLGQ
eukprot:SAG22_NODE_1623_length_3962_cov_20.394253_3_plen_128_part_00